MFGKRDMRHRQAEALQQMYLETYEALIVKSAIEKAIEKLGEEFEEEKKHVGFNQEDARDAMNILDNILVQIEKETFEDGEGVKLDLSEKNAEAWFSAALEETADDFKKGGMPGEARILEEVNQIFLQRDHAGHETVKYNSIDLPTNKETRRCLDCDTKIQVRRRSSA